MNDPGFGGIIDRYPRVNQHWNGGKPDFSLDFVVSKEAATLVEVSG